MTPEIIISSMVIFIVLLVTHYIALTVGFDMGAKADFTKVQMAEKPKKNVGEYVPGPDPLDEEMLDYE